jgi:hypothetical protein
MGSMMTTERQENTMKDEFQARWEAQRDAELRARKAIGSDVQDFVDASVERYGNYAFAAGYLNSLVVELLTRHVAPAERDRILENLRTNVDAFTAHTKAAA